MSKAMIIALASLLSACASVRTYDAQGNLTGSCKARGFMSRAAQCIGTSLSQPSQTQNTATASK